MRFDIFFSVCLSIRFVFIHFLWFLLHRIIINSKRFNPKIDFFFCSIWLFYVWHLIMMMLQWKKNKRFRHHRSAIIFNMIWYFLAIKIQSNIKWCFKLGRMSSNDFSEGISMEVTKYLSVGQLFANAKPWHACDSTARDMDIFPSMDKMLVILVCYMLGESTVWCLWRDHSRLLIGARKEREELMMNQRKPWINRQNVFFRRWNLHRNRLDWLREWSSNVSSLVLFVSVFVWARFDHKQVVIIDN